jgi:hypothetical protein
VEVVEKLPKSLIVKAGGLHSLSQELAEIQPLHPLIHPPWRCSARQDVDRHDLEALAVGDLSQAVLRAQLVDRIDQT